MVVPDEMEPLRLWSREDVMTVVDCDAVRWWQLINEMEDVRDRTGMGLAGVWAHVHRGEYAKARELFDQVES